MKYILLRAAALCFIIFIAIWMRRKGILGNEAGKIFKIILMYITLPSAIICNFLKNDGIESSMIFLILTGIAVNLIMIAVGLIITRNSLKSESALFMNCLPAYNIGAFCLPFVQSFLPIQGSITACMFDAGNSIMCTGGTYALVSEYLSEKNTDFSLYDFVRRIITSVPLMTYIIMITLSLCHIRIPEAVATFLSPVASANVFIAMFMLGLLFEIRFEKSFLIKIVLILGIRHVAAVIFAVFFYYLLPLELVVRQTLVILSFGPMSVVAPVYTQLCGGDEQLASAAGSISIILSIFEITILLMIMGI